MGVTQLCGQSYKQSCSARDVGMRGRTITRRRTRIWGATTQLRSSTRWSMCFAKRWRRLNKNHGDFHRYVVSHSVHCKTVEMSSDNGFQINKQIQAMCKTHKTKNIIQFLHRFIAYLLLFFIVILNYFFIKNKLNIKNIIFFDVAILLQVFLGIITLLSGVEIKYASLHQLGSIFVLTTYLAIIYKNSNQQL